MCFNENAFKNYVTVNFIIKNKSFKKIKKNMNF